MKYLMRLNNVLCFVTSIFCVLCSVQVYAGGEEVLFQDIADDIGIHINGIDNFQVKKNIKREGRDNTFWTIVGESDGCTIKIEAIYGISEEAARHYAQTRKKIITSLYDQIPSPYPGMVSHSIESPQAYKPNIEHIPIEGKKTDILFLTATKRYTYGASVDDLIAYRSALVFVYDVKGKTLFRIDYFVPKKNFKKEFVLKIFSSLSFDSKHAETIYNSDERKEKADTLEKRADKKSDYTKYNVILIALEPLGAQHMSAYGYTKKTTPHIDAFADHAILFKNAISPSSWTLPAFMSWFTSLYPSQHKVVNKYSSYTADEHVIANMTQLVPEVRTLAQVFKQNGYHTAGFTGGAGVGKEFGYAEGFDVYWHDEDVTFGGFDAVLPQTLTWIKAHQEEPFFVFAQGYDAHPSYQLPDGYHNVFIDSTYTGTLNGTTEEYNRLLDEELRTKKCNLTDDDFHYLASWYDAKINEADKKIGKFLDELKALSTAGKTIIIFSSGSGNEYGEHGQLGHGLTLYDELIRIPFIIQIPGVEPRIVDQQVRLIDLMPTLIDILDLNSTKKVDEQMEGVSLRPLIEGKKLSLDAFSETDFLYTIFKRALRTSDGWKYIYSIDTDERELYDLSTDPGEMHSCVHQRKHRASDLEEKLFYYMQKTY